MAKKVICDVKYEREPRQYTSKALKRIYCNYLNDANALSFRKWFLESKGDCGLDFRPCEDIADKFDQAVASVKEIEGTSGDMMDGLNDMVEYYKESMSKAVEESVNDVKKLFKSEDVADKVDSALEPYIENSIDRGEAVSSVVDNAVIGFVDDSMYKRFIEINDSEGVGARIDLSRALSKKLALAVASITAVAVFFKGVYDVYVDSCVEDK